MISNLKKLALGIMSAGGILVPLAVVASCGTTEKDEDIQVTVKTNPVMTQEDINGDNYKSLATLEKLFIGVTASNVNNFTVTLDPIGNEYVITLRAKDGYTIDGKKTLTSEKFTIPSIDIDITTKTLNPGDIKPEDVENNAFKSYATLQKLFSFDTTVITEELLNKAVTITMTPMSGSQPRIVKLTANPGYSINGSSSLDSNSFVILINYVINQAATVPTD
ncbi:MAG: hypothetical protein ACRDCH_00115, partial [Metamycoplasmataceae bacterium]